MKNDTTKKILGLTSAQVEESRRKHGANSFTPPPPTPIWKQLVEKFKDPLIKILMLALTFSIGIACYNYFYLNEGAKVFFEPVGIAVAIILATVIGFWLEMKANKKFELLNQEGTKTKIKTYRDGEVTEIDRIDLVVGDVIILDAGEEIPADGVLINSEMLRVNESTLTGEPSVRKSHRQEDADQEATYPTNHIMCGTTILEGNAVAEIIAVGDNSEYGKVYVATQIESGVKTPLTIQLERLGTLISYGSYIAGGLIIVGRLISFLHAGGDFTSIEFLAYLLNTLMIAITLIVVSVPEGLPMSITMSLALSMRRMLATNNLVRKLHACETMGATTVICTDKTGTLTQNRMHVSVKLFPDDEQYNALIAEQIASNTTAFIGHDAKGAETTLGNPTEGALLLMLRKQGIDYETLRQSLTVHERLPFSTERKYMATVVRSIALDRNVVYVKGAPEIIMNHCATIGGNISKQQIFNSLADYQARAMRTLGFAYAILPDGQSAFQDGKLAISNLEFMGIVGITDPVREDVPDAIKECTRAGINVTIVTGDTTGTAREIGKQVGLLTDDSDERACISGTEFSELSDEEALERVADLRIMSRARPLDKQRLVSLLQKRGEVVAVTGDGTNDAPALNAAQVGLSMGDGTSVAKEASDITILDNSFASISRAVMWGRSLYRNIQRFILFQLTVNVTACLVVALGSFTSLQSPLTVTQMLWVNLIMDTFAALALSSLPPSEKVMRDKPRKPEDFIITKSMWWFIGGCGIAMFLFLFGVLQYLHHYHIGLNAITFSPVQYINSFFKFDYDSKERIDTIELTYFFTTFVFLQFWNLFNAKAFMSGESAFANFKESKVFFGTVLAIFLGQIAIVYLGDELFNVTNIPFSNFMLIFLGTSVVLVIGEIWRYCQRRFRKD